MEQLAGRPEREPLDMNTHSEVKLQEIWISCSDVDFNSHSTKTRGQKQFFKTYNTNIFMVSFLLIKVCSDWLIQGIISLRCSQANYVPTETRQTVIKKLFF